MIEIDRERPAPEHYGFIRECYPWCWGSYEKFRWKHLEDPYRGDDFYVMREEGRLLSLCVARRYPFFYGGEELSALSMMDFVTSPAFRGRGLISRLSEAASAEPENRAADLAIGFSGERLSGTVHRSRTLIQIFHAYRFPPRSEDAGLFVIESDEETAEALNSNPQALQMRRDKALLDRIRSRPDYGRFVAARTEGLVFGMGVGENEVRVLELSEFSVEASLAAVKAAGSLGKPVVADFPGELDMEGALLVKRTFVTASGRMSDFFSERRRIWIPAAERK
jgi:GNAT superfamily N-acetyltransferase